MLARAKEKERESLAICRYMFVLACLVQFTFKRVKYLNYGQIVDRSLDSCNITKGHLGEMSRNIGADRTLHRRKFRSDRMHSVVLHFRTFEFGSNREIEVQNFDNHTLNSSKRSDENATHSTRSFPLSLAIFILIMTGFCFHCPQRKRAQNIIITIIMN